MSDIMTPIPFGNLMNWILKEHEKGAVFGIGVIISLILSYPPCLSPFFTGGLPYYKHQTRSQHRIQSPPSGQAAQDCPS